MNPDKTGEAGGSNEQSNQKSYTGKYWYMKIRSLTRPRPPPGHRHRQKLDKNSKDYDRTNFSEDNCIFNYSLRHLELKVNVPNQGSSDEMKDEEPTAGVSQPCTSGRQCEKSDEMAKDNSTEIVYEATVGDGMSCESGCQCSVSRMNADHLDEEISQVNNSHKPKSEQGGNSDEDPSGI